MVEVGVCLCVDGLALLADAVKENPGSRVSVVLIARSERSFQRRKLQTLKELGEYSIPRHRVRVFEVISRKPNPFGIKPEAEYWLLP